MTCDEQLAKWLEGISVHNIEMDECCPDFSCCDPDLLVDRATRQAFVNADEELRMSMLGMFLVKMIESTRPPSCKDMKIHLAGFDDPEKQYGKGS